MASYTIKANVFGKIKYWNFIEGLHSGKGKYKGFQIYKTEIEAPKEIKLLQKVFHSGIIWEVIPHSEIPFIKAQKRQKSKKS